MIKCAIHVDTVRGFLACSYCGLINWFEQIGLFGLGGPAFSMWDKEVQLHVLLLQALEAVLRNCSEDVINKKI